MENKLAVTLRSIAPGTIALGAVAATALILTVSRGPTMYQPAATPPAAADYGRMPLRFEENRGQSDPAVRFIARGPRYSLFVTPNAVTWRLRGENRQAAAVSMHFAGAQLAPAVRGESPLQTQSQYLRGNDGAQWITGVRNFGAVHLEALYPGVDAKLYGNEQRLEYDFIVAPGADPSQIRLRFDGVEDIVLGEKGELILKTAVGNLIQRAPVAYQLESAHHPESAHAERRTTVQAHFVRAGEREVTFELGPYDLTRALIIDPVYEYSTYLGGSGNESFTSSSGPNPYETLAVNAAGEVYVAGITTSIDFPQTSGGVQPTHAPSSDFDFYVGKLNATGDALLFATYLGGTGDELGIGGLVVDGTGNVYVGGLTQSVDFPTTSSAYAETARGPAGSNQDIVIFKLNPTGSALTYSTYLGSNASDSIAGFGVDAGGNAYVAGSTLESASIPFPVTAGAMQTSGDQFVTKLSPDGSALAYSTRFGGFLGEIRIRAMTVDGAGHVYLTGVVNTDNLPTTANVVGPTRSGSFDAFVSKLNTGGTGLDYSTYLGGSFTDEGRAIAVDAAGNAYIAGSTPGGAPGGPANNFPTTAGAYKTTAAAEFRGFLTKLNPTGSALEFSTFLAAPGISSNNAIELDGSGRIYLALDGAAPNALHIDEPPEVCTVAAGSQSVARISADGSAVDYSMRVGGMPTFSSGSDVSLNLVVDLAVDGGNSVYLVGTTNSADLPTYKAFQTTLGGSDDAFVAKISDAPTLAMPTLEFAQSAFTGTQGTSATITVNRTGRAAGLVRVQAKTSDGTATAGMDYTATDTVLEWRNGDLSPKTFTVPLSDNGAGSGGKTVNLALTKSGCLGDPGTLATAVLTTAEAGTPPPPPTAPGTLQLSAATYSANEGAGNASIVVTRTGGSDGAVSARLVTVNGSAAAGADYTAQDIIVTFADGDAAAKTVSIPVIQDTADEPDETVNLTLSTPTGGATLGAQTTAVLTVVDDDATPATPAKPPAAGGGGGATDGSTLLALLGALLVAMLRQSNLLVRRASRQ